MVVRCSRACWPGARKHTSRRSSPSATRNCCRREFPARHPRFHLVRSGARAPRPESSRCADRSIQRCIHERRELPEDFPEDRAEEPIRPHADLADHPRRAHPGRSRHRQQVCISVAQARHTVVTALCFGWTPEVHGSAALTFPLVDFLYGLERTTDSLLPPRLRAAPARAVPSVFRPAS